MANLRVMIVKSVFSSPYSDNFFLVSIPLHSFKCVPNIPTGDSQEGLAKHPQQIQAHSPLGKA